MDYKKEIVNKVPYPDYMIIKKQIEEKYANNGYYKLPLKVASDRIDKDAKDEYIAKMKEYNIGENERIQTFKKVAFEDLGYSDWSEKKKDIVFSRAWDEGHSYGFNEVFNCLSDLIDFVNELERI